MVLRGGKFASRKPATKKKKGSQLPLSKRLTKSPFERKQKVPSDGLQGGKGCKNAQPESLSSQGPSSAKFLMPTEREKIEIHWPAKHQLQMEEYSRKFSLQGLKRRERGRVRSRENKRKMTHLGTRSVGTTSVWSGQRQGEEKRKKREKKKVPIWGCGHT